MPDTPRINCLTIIMEANVKLSFGFCRASSIKMGAQKKRKGTPLPLVEGGEFKDYLIIWINFSYISSTVDRLLALAWKARWVVMTSTISRPISTLDISRL